MPLFPGADALRRIPFSSRRADLRVCRSRQRRSVALPRSDGHPAVVSDTRMVSLLVPGSPFKERRDRSWLRSLPSGLHRHFPVRMRCNASWLPNPARCARHLPQPAPPSLAAHMALGFTREARACHPSCSRMSAQTDLSVSPNRPVCRLKPTAMSPRRDHDVTPQRGQCHPALRSLSANIGVSVTPQGLLVTDRRVSVTSQRDLCQPTSRSMSGNIGVYVRQHRGWFKLTWTALSARREVGSR